MNIAILLMAGSGERLCSSIPKQFIMINVKRLFVYSLETFLNIDRLDKIILVTNNDYIDLTKDELIFRNINSNKIDIIPGGNTRTKSLKLAVDHINQNFPNASLVITHDVARALVSQDLINKHIDEWNNNKNSIINTYIKCTDTLSQPSSNLNTIIDRSKIIRHQTPQSIDIKILNNIFDNQPIEYYENKTDLCDLCSINSIPTINVEGSETNFKITTKYDLEIFKFIVSKKI